jgi:hypothetical protein
MFLYLHCNLVRQKKSKQNKQMKQMTNYKKRKERCTLHIFEKCVLVTLHIKYHSIVRNDTPCISLNVQYTEYFLFVICLTILSAAQTI